MMKVIIIGGGIGGLCTALCLKKAGFEVKVFESVKEIKPLGVGINTLPHCVRVTDKPWFTRKNCPNCCRNTRFTVFQSLRTKVLGRATWTLCWL